MPAHVDWPAIFGGAAIAAAIAFILTTFGTAIGLSLVSPFEGEGVAPLGVLIAVAIWVIWVAVSSAMAGGYVAARLRRRSGDATEHEVGVRDGLHGLIVWAIGLLVGATVLATAIGTTARVGAEAASAAVEAVPGEALTEGYEYAADSLLRAPDQEPGAAMADIREAVVRIFRAGAAGEGVPDEDRQYLVQLVASRTGIPQEEATARVNAAIERLQAAEQKAREVADTARKAAIVSAFVVAASLLIAAAGAFWAAGVGGRHRDEETVLPFFSRWS
jgi:hypothetical protein